MTELRNINPNNVPHIAFGLVGFSGPLSYTQTIPNNIDITEFDTVFFFCLQFTAFWDVGFISPFSANTCSILSVNDFSLDKVSIYPNPATHKIQLSNFDGISAEVRIFNLLGKQVFHQPKVTENAIDVSQFNKGIYIVKISEDGKSKTQKLIIQ